MGTEIKKITGFHGTKEDIMPKKREIVVRFTSDKYGETISLEDGNIIMGVPFEKVMKLIEKARKSV